MFFKNIEMCFQAACSILNKCNLFSISSNMCIEYNKRKESSWVYICTVLSTTQMTLSSLRAIPTRRFMTTPILFLMGCLLVYHTGMYMFDSDQTCTFQCVIPIGDLSKLRSAWSSNQ